MGGFIAIFSCLTFLGFYAIVVRIWYVLFRKSILWLNTQVIVKKAPRLIFACFSRYIGLKFKGDYSNIKKLPEQYLLISNHQSILDIVAYMRYHNGPRLRFVAKKELENNVPLVSIMLKTAKHCLVKRTGSPSQAMQALDKFADHVLKNNLIPVIFPEGTRSKTGELGAFHAAGFRRILNKAPMPVAVCAIDGGWKISSLRRMAKNLRGGEYKVKTLKIYDAPHSKEEQVKILTEAKQLIQEQLDKWRS